MRLHGATAHTRELSIQVVAHRTSDLLIAISEDLPGLMVTGRSYEELHSRLPGSIREILEAQGIEVSDITADEDTQSHFPASFHSFAFKARAEIVNS